MGVVSNLIESIREDYPVEDVLVGAFDCMVVSRGAGLSSTFRDPCGVGARGAPSRGVKNAGALVGMGARDLAGYAGSMSLLDASVGVSALNSLIRPEPSAFVEVNAFEILAEKGKGRKVAVVGRFPFLKKLSALVLDLQLVQRPPWQREEALREAADKLTGADVVAITASSIINHTFDRLLQISRDAYVVVLGPSTPLSPLLFDLGVDALCGTFVEDSGLARRSISEGANYRQIRGIRRVAICREQS